ncbi:hypothetical protein A3I51_00405 [Candidatus Gottesmanbacteria bacterium RIFCSPLOWO2_02_FULL_38_8]|uniref:Uncharacterized protein n=1 Tax=Candidatus Gottesmanbacteria bacterium RIFCSPLOWO2_02_FULL_38_8 TaxID=1798397 RepID=A0A1F6B5G4_9BACT|nr:MAG: hypothetical protein A3I51_00405 [Candidatus Gottesmanbacteria bacterium RIFCSPLOWO2_02_FULL_38_8]
MRRIDSFQEKQDTTLFIGPGNTLKQTFLARADGLAGIRLAVYNPKLGGTSKYKLTLSNEANQIIWQDYILEANLGWAEEFRYDFEAVPESENKLFSLKVSYAEENDNSESDREVLSLVNSYNLEEASIPKESGDISSLVQKNYLSLGYGRGDNYADGAAFLEGRQLKGDLVFKTYYKTTLSTFIKDSGVQFFSRIRQDVSFFTFYFIMLFSLIYLLVRFKMLRGK